MHGPVTSPPCRSRGTALFQLSSWNTAQLPHRSSHDRLAVRNQSVMGAHGPDGCRFPGPIYLRFASGSISVIWYTPLVGVSHRHKGRGVRRLRRPGTLPFWSGWSYTSPGRHSGVAVMTGTQLMRPGWPSLCVRTRHGRTG